jgi:hypothetical protein
MSITRGAPGGCWAASVIDNPPIATSAPSTWRRFMIETSNA